MSLRDRGTKKWTAMMLPEHVLELKKSLIDESKRTKPILDEQEIEIMEEIILGAMGNNNPLLFSIYKDGFIKTIRGNIDFIDYIKKEFRVKDNLNNIHFILFKDIVCIEKIENP